MQPLRRSFRALSAGLLAILLADAALAGGAWVPKPGDGDLRLGASRRRAQSSWGRQGQVIENQTDHDLRYALFSGEVGLCKGLSASWTLTYLDGLEGRPASLEQNAGMSDAWLGLKYGFRQDTGSPLAVGFTYRTPMFYDQAGAYDRHTFNADGSLRGVSSEWRGLLKHDYTLLLLASHSLWRGRGWTSLTAGYTWREGAPADQVPVYIDLGVPLPWLRMRAKVAGNYVGSVGNESPRRPDDRFGKDATNDLNDASMARLTASLIVPLEKSERWYVEAGYNQWVWGRSTRRYQEPYLSVGRNFGPSYGR